MNGGGGALLISLAASPRLVVLFAAAFYSGHAIGQPPTRCAPLSTTPVNDANATLVSATASETQIWKTITVGGSKGVNAVRVAMETAPCGIAIGDDADEILGRPAFPFYQNTSRTGPCCPFGA